MKFWEKFQPEQFKNNEPKSWWWWVFATAGFLIGLIAVVPIVLLVFLALGFFVSLLWNYAVSPIFNISEITTYTAGALLFLIFALIRIIKWALG